ETLIAGIRQGESIRDFVHVKELLEGYLATADRATGAVAAEARAITTGFMDLDTLLGGLKRMDLIVVAARPSVGKTSLALNFARNAAARQQATVGIFSVEMAGEQIVQRLLASESGVDSTRLGFGTHSDREQGRIVNALGVLSELNIYFDDTALLTVAEMRAKARRLHLERGLDLLIVDHLQLMHSGMRHDNRVQEVSYITRSLKELARDLDVPLVACSQLSRALEARPTHIPQLSDLRDSGSIEQDADVVMFIYREEKHVDRDEWQRQHPDRPAENAEDTKPTAVRRVIDRIRLGRGVRIQGVDGMLVRYAQCCQPVPGDTVVGYGVEIGVFELVPSTLFSPNPVVGSPPWIDLLLHRVGDRQDSSRCLARAADGPAIVHGPLC
ncbi:hypothetical protein LCGC14_2906590, partial [marine sediment metagenome]